LLLLVLLLSRHSSVFAAPVSTQVILELNNKKIVYIHIYIYIYIYIYT
jgi:hypothetical protein